MNSFDKFLFQKYTQKKSNNTTQCVCHLHINNYNKSALEQNNIQSLTLTLHTYWLPGLQAGEKVWDRLMVLLLGPSWGLLLMVGRSEYMDTVLVSLSQVTAVIASSWSVELPLSPSMYTALWSSSITSLIFSS